MRCSQGSGDRWGRLGRVWALFWLVAGLTPWAIATEVAATPVEVESPAADPLAESEKLEAVSDAGQEPGLSAAESDSKTEEFAHDLNRYPSLEVPTQPWSYSGHYIFGLTRGLADEDLPAWERGACMVGTVPLDLVGLPAALVAGLFGS
ncbi:hypothetical protein MK280_09480 [Myxococcota bacterium]|nr:hypothetical protein [Myxococcota bacterium]